MLFINNIFCLNLTMHDYDNPSATHILDAEIIDDVLIISGMLGGIEFYDISNREVLNHLSNLQISGGGGGSGGSRSGSSSCSSSSFSSSFSCSKTAKKSSRSSSISMEICTGSSNH